MAEKKNINENQMWTMSMAVIPVVILMNVGNELTDDSGMRILYAGLFGGIGGLLGFAAIYLTKGKNRGIKILATIITILISGLTIYLLSSKPTDSEILEQEWVTQKIGKIEFDSPTKLELQKNEIPETVKWFYSELNLYSDENTERSTSFLQTKILIDTLSIESGFAGALEGMLQKMEINLDDVELEIFGAEEDEISSMFSFELNGRKVNGYGYMYLKGKTLESIWLMPLERGFSKEYIEVFEMGIVPDYE